MRRALEGGEGEGGMRVRKYKERINGGEGRGERGERREEREKRGGERGEGREKRGEGEMKTSGVA